MKGEILWKAATDLALKPQVYVFSVAKIRTGILHSEFARGIFGIFGGSPCNYLVPSRVFGDGMLRGTKNCVWNLSFSLLWNLDC